MGQYLCMFLDKRTYCTQLFVCCKVRQLKAMTVRKFIMMSQICPPRLCSFSFSIRLLQCTLTPVSMPNGLVVRGNLCSVYVFYMAKSNVHWKWTKIMCFRNRHQLQDVSNMGNVWKHKCISFIVGWCVEPFCLYIMNLASQYLGNFIVV